MAKEERSLPMANTISGISRTVKLMAMECFKILTEESMKASGRKTNSMESAKKSGTMDKRPMKVSFQMVKRMEKESSCGKTVPTMKVTLLMDFLRAMALTISKSLIRHILAYLTKVALKDKESFNGLMVVLIGGISEMEKKMVKALSDMQTATYT